MEENKTMELERWFSLEGISKHLGVSKDTIHGWIKMDTIPYYKDSINSRSQKWKLGLKAARVSTQINNIRIVGD